MKLERFSGLLLACIACITIQSCVSAPTLPGVAKKTQAVSVSRVITFDKEDASKKPITAEIVAKAVANAYPYASKFGPASSWGSDPAWSCIGGCPNGTSGPLTKSNTQGVSTRSSGNLVSFEYVREVSMSGGTGRSVTKGSLQIDPIQGEPGRFSISATSISEFIDLAPGLGFIGLSPLAPIDIIAEDVSSAASKLKPHINNVYIEQTEFDIDYPVASVFSNYERKFGKPRRSHDESNISQDSREGRFNLSGEKITNEAFISVRPYRNAAKVRISINVPYQLNEGGGSTFSTAAINLLMSNLKKIAFD